MKYHILRRQMTSPGAPKRKLSWDAIEQIRSGLLSGSKHSIKMFLEINNLTNLTPLSDI